jgi:hypothetical protein
LEQSLSKSTKKYWKKIEREKRMIPLSVLKRHLFWHGEQWEWESEEDREREIYEKEENDGE